MKLTHTLALLPLALASLTANAQTVNTQPDHKGSTFHFSTQVSRTVEKDLMVAEIYSRQAGKNLADLKKAVSKHLNSVVETAKKSPDIELLAEGVGNYADYDSKGKVIGWVAEGRVQLTSKNFDAVAAILENLGNEVAIARIDFSVSPEKLASLEDKMTLDILKQFEHKAKLIQKGLNAGSYRLSDIQLNTPNGEQLPLYTTRAYEPAMLKSAMSSEELPLEAGKQTISASASGKVIFE